MLNKMETSDALVIKTMEAFLFSSICLHVRLHIILENRWIFVKYTRDFHLNLSKHYDFR
jgi:hypothetical protein